MKNYESFFEDMWDEVSTSIVTDDIWYSDETKFQELTYELYHIYKSNVITLPDGNSYPAISDKVFARIVESMFKNFKEKFDG